MTAVINGSELSPLRRKLDETIAERGGSMKDLTVLSPQNDPFRLDLPDRHRDGEWLAITAQDLGLGDQKVHLRGLHYMVLGQPKPDGTPYSNTEADWLWLSQTAGKAARFLGYLPFDQIVDQRNAPPVVRTAEEREEPWSYVHASIRVDIPAYQALEPVAGLANFTGTQPRKLVLVGEKSSLDNVLAPIAAKHDADLYLPTGCMSDTLIHQMARVGAEDGRPIVVLYFADCDPSGWNMPIEVGRKLQAFQTSLFPELEFEVHRVALTPDQVREHELPSTPLKASEKRADSWTAAMGVQQTEIDALASLRPDLLRTIARNAIEPFYDYELNRRVAVVKEQWLTEAQAVVDQGSDEQMEQLRDDAARKLDELRDEIAALNDALRVGTEGFDLPPIPPIPEALLNRGNAQPLLDSRWSFAEQCKALIESKAYRGVE